MQYVENLSDRQAADALRARIDWKSALSLPLTDSGFDFSILSEFCPRLLTSDREQFLLDKLLEQLREKGLLKTHQRCLPQTPLTSWQRFVTKTRLETLGDFRAAQGQPDSCCLQQVSLLHII